MAGPSPSRVALVLAFAAVYVIWGSTYLAIRVAVDTIPPFLMAAARWIPPGLLLYAWCRGRGAAPPTPAQWRTAAVVGLLLIVGGNGLVSWAEQTVPSGFAALLIAVVPVWIALLQWLRPGGVLPSWRVSAGILLGLCGVALLVLPAALGRVQLGEGVLLGSLLVLVASFSWASGSLYGRGAPQNPSTFLNAAMQMIVGGVALLLLGLATGEGARLNLAAITPASWAALAFLAILGSIVAYSAYLWLLSVTRPQLVATYAFVNPVVAVLLGTLLLDEAFTFGTGVAAAVIVVAVALVVTAPAKR